VSGLACRESSESLAARGRQSCRGRGPASLGTQVSVRVMARCQWLTDHPIPPSQTEPVVEMRLIAQLKKVKF